MKHEHGNSKMNFNFIPAAGAGNRQTDKSVNGRTDKPSRCSVMELFPENKLFPDFYSKFRKTLSKYGQISHQLAGALS